MGKSALSSSSPRAEEQGRGRARRRRPSGGSGARERPGGGGKEGEKLKGSITPLNFGEGGPQGRDSWRQVAAGGGGHGGAAVGLAGGQGEEGE